MLSICVTIKNRSRVKVGDRELLLFPRCVESIAQSAARYLDCELVVADWQSDDWPLSLWLEKAAAPVSVRVITIPDVGFSRGKGLNRAAAAARGDALLFLDADCLLCESVITRGLECVGCGSAYYPVLFSYKGPEHRDGWWRHTGYGMCLLGKDLYQQSGGWPEYTLWGKEDDHFLQKIRSLAEVVREEVPGFYHQWHPDDTEWKEQHMKPTEAELSARRQEQESLLREMKDAARDIEQHVPPGHKYILVDEAWLEATIPPERVAIPFLERDGQYWGLPADDWNAISECDRLRAAGATFMVFAEPAFWWLDHYAGFADHLRSSYPRILDNNVVVIFDMR
jgi:hypothetical protein